MSKATKEHAQEIFNLLKRHYPEAKMILQWSNNWELLVSIILSAQCTDKKVNEVTMKLFPKFQELKLKGERVKLDGLKITPEIQEIVNFAEVPITELEQDIRSTGFYKAKANNVQKAARVVLERFKGILPKTIAELTTIPGVGRKTANVFLTNAYNINEGIAVDTHVTKQAKALGLTTETDPVKIEQDLMSLYPQNQWHDITYLLIEHGRNLRMAKAKQATCGDATCVLCNG